MKNKKEIQSLFQEQNNYWQYQCYDQDNIAKINQFFDQNQKDFEKSMTQDLKHNIQYLIEKLGINQHPSFDCKYVSQNFIFFQNVKVDYCTIKVLQFVTKYSKIETLKFQNNVFSIDEINLVKQLCNENIQNIFIDYNDFEQSQILQEIGQFNNLKTLVLRSNNLTDQCFELLSQGLISNDQIQLQSLELFDNKLTQLSIEPLNKLIESNLPIEYISLANNKIENIDSVIEILIKKPLNEQEIHEYKQKQADLLKKKGNKKVEKTDIIQVGDNYYYAKNEKLQILNFAINQIQTISNLDLFLRNCDAEFKLILQTNPVVNEIQQHKNLSL